MASVLNRKTPITDRKEYLALAKQYHPDSPGGSAEAMAHINALYSDDYTPPNQIRVGSLIYNYESNPSPNQYVGRSSVLFIHNQSHTAPVFTFPDTRAQAEMAKYLPVYVKSEETYDVIGKDKKLLSLRQYLSHFVSTPHGSWIISSLYNLLCYLEWAKLTHNAICIDNIFFDPDAHSAHLLGGWWFSKPLHAPMSHLPAYAVSINPRLAKAKRASHSFDLALIKRLGLELNGDRTGMSLDRQSPKFGFLRSPTSGSAITDYRLWMESLGTRKFVKLEIPS